MSETIPSSNAPGTPRLIEIELENSTRRRTIAVVAIGLSVAAVMALTALAGLIWIAVFQGLLFTGLAVWLAYYFYFARRLVGADVARILCEHESQPIEEAIRAVYGPVHRVTDNYRARELARELAERMQFGLTVRVRMHEELDAVEPLVIQFDPQPLYEAHASFDRFDDPSRAEAALSNVSRTPTLRRLRRNILFAGGWIAILAWGMNMIVGVLVSYESRRVTWQAIVYIGVPVLILWFGRSAYTSRSQWLLVSGGVVVRKSRMGAGEWSLHLFDRRTSAMVVYQAYRHRWAACVSDASMSARAPVTQAEVKALLRAWLSPLPPPPLEQLSDLV